MQGDTGPDVGSKADGEAENCLHLDLHTHEDVWMRQIGHLKDWCSQTRSVKLGVPTLVATPLAAASIRLLFLFQNLQHLDISFNSTRCRIEQPVLVACAELLKLTTLNISGGHLDRHGLDLGVLTSLRQLHTLSVRPHTDEELDGLEDEHLATAARLTGLRSLSLRASENLTDEGICALTALTGLTRLSLVPMGLCVTREGVTALSNAMPQLAELAVGLHESRQVAALKGLADRCRTPNISVVLNSPEVSTSGFFSTLTLVLRPSLVSLRMATVESTDASFLLAVGTLVHLKELKMGVSLPEGGQPYTCSLATLSSLSRLNTLEFAVTQELRLPLSVKLVSMLALSWPELRSLSLSVMSKPEVVPEALDLLDNFRNLTSLSLFSPLDYSCDEDADRIVLPVTPRYLPPGLTHLVLECAEVRDQPHGRSSEHVGQQSEQVQDPGSPAASGAATERQSRPLVPQLQHLELTSCRIADDHLTAILQSATGVRHLELSDVRGVTHEAVQALRGLTRLEHLVVHLTDTSAPPSGRAVTHQSLTALRNAATLRHLEWSLPEPLSASALAEISDSVLSSLGGLQDLALDVTPELRVGSGRVPAAAKTAVARAGAATEGQGEAGANGSGPTWREKLQRSLPLCTIADRPGIVVYDLWNDRTIQVVEP